MNKIVRYAIDFYDLMASQAATDSQGHLIFQGRLTQVYREVGASTAYYSKIRRLLTETGAIEILQKGAGDYPSIVRLDHRLDPEEISAEGLTDAGDRATLTEVDARVRRLEGWRESTGGGNIGNILRNFEERLSKLESVQQTGD